MHPCLAGRLSRALWCISWTWLEPAVSGRGQPWPLLAEAVPAGPSTPKNFPVVPQIGSQNHAPQVLLNNLLVVGPLVPSKYMALDSKMVSFSGTVRLNSKYSVWANFV